MIIQCQHSTRGPWPLWRKQTPKTNTFHQTYVLRVGIYWRHWHILDVKDSEKQKSASGWSVVVGSPQPQALELLNYSMTECGSFRGGNLHNNPHGPRDHMRVSWCEDHCANPFDRSLAFSLSGPPRCGDGVFLALLII